MIIYYLFQEKVGIHKLLHAMQLDHVIIWHKVMWHL